jgi:hypothetical protein
MPGGLARAVAVAPGELFASQSMQRISRTVNLHHNSMQHNTPEIATMRDTPRRFQSTVPTSPEVGFSRSFVDKKLVIHRLYTTAQHRQAHLSTHHPHVHQQPRFAAAPATSSVGPSEALSARRDRNLSSD